MSSIILNSLANINWMSEQHKQSKRQYYKKKRQWEKVFHSSWLSVFLTSRRGPRDDGAFGLANDDFAVFANISGWSCWMR